MGSSLYAQFEPLPEEVQRAFFQGKKHVLKGDLDEAYASFQNCAEAAPKVGAFHFETRAFSIELLKLKPIARPVAAHAPNPPDHLGESWACSR